MDLLTDRIKDDMKAAMKGGDKARLGVIRLILAAIKQVEVDERIQLDNDRTILVLDKLYSSRQLRRDRGQLGCGCNQSFVGKWSAEWLH